MERGEPKQEQNNKKNFQQPKHYAFKFNDHSSFILSGMEKL